MSMTQPPDVPGILSQIHTNRELSLYFLAFARELSRFEVQLCRMFGVSEDGLRDRLTEFSRPTTGSYWFAPSEQALARLGTER